VVEAKRRYSPAPLAKATKIIRNGKLAEDLISTSHVERAGLSMRMGMRRFTRVTNAFSKKLENHMRAVSFYFMGLQLREDPLQHQDHSGDGSGRDGLPLEHGRRRAYGGHERLGNDRAVCRKSLCNGGEAVHSGLVFRRPHLSNRVRAGSSRMAISSRSP
jgi:hypothetical protein